MKSFNKLQCVFAVNVEKNSANLLRLNPSDEIVFNKLPQGEIMAKVEVTNITDKTVVFKVSLH